MSFLKKLFGQGEPSTNNQKESHNYETTIASLNNEQIIEKVLPVILTNKSKLPKGITLSDPIVVYEFVEDLVITYAIEMNNKLHYLKRSKIEALNLPNIENIHGYAIRNLSELIKKDFKLEEVNFESTIPGAKPFYKINLHPFISPSIMLIDKMWSKIESSEFGGQLLCVSIPDKQTIHFSNLFNQNAYIVMKQIGLQIFSYSETMGEELSPNLYVRKNNQWIKYLDTVEEFLELTDDIEPPLDLFFK